MKQKTKIGLDNKTWPQTMDAEIWTREWIKRVKEKPEIATDRETMIGWFANSIMAGFDEATRRNQKVA